MKKIILAAFLIFNLVRQSNAQVFPFNDDFESYTAFNVPTGYTGNITVYLTHGTAASKGLAGFLTSFSNSDSLIFPQIGPVSQFATLEFDWRMMQPSLYPSTPANLSAGDNFDMLVSTDGLTWTSVFNVNNINFVSTTNFTHASVSLSAYVGNNIFLQMKGRRANGSDEFFIDVDNVVVDQPGHVISNELNSFSVYPTIATGILNFSNPFPINGDLEIMDINGKLILKKKLDSVSSGQVDISAIQSGKYLVKIITSKGNKISSIVVR